MAYNPGPISVNSIGVATAIAPSALERYWGGGQILWVGNRSDLKVGNGSSPANPLSSVFGAAGALAKLQATTSRGHVIFVLPGHAENVAAADAGSAQGAANSFAIVGLGQRTTRPAFTWTADAATWLLDTADIAIDNVQMFMAGPTASTTARTVAAAMTISGAGCSLRNNYIQVGVDADQIVTVAIVVTGKDCVIEKNTIIGDPTAEITATGTVIRLTGADRCIIRDNYISAATATDTDGMIETLTTASLDVQITGNEIYSSGGSSTCCIDFGQALACTGFIDRNNCTVDADGTAHTVVFTVSATANMALGNFNYFVSNNNERGLIFGVATT